MAALIRAGQLFYFGRRTPEHPVGENLLERVLERDNLRQALRHVECNGGSAGVDGMNVEDLRPYLKENWDQIRESILTGNYRPQPVRRVEIPKPGEGVRKLGVPIVLETVGTTPIPRITEQRY